MSKLIKNYIYNSIYQILLIIIPIITMPYIARVLGAESIGINSYINSISTIFIYIGMLGLDKYASREIAYNRENDDTLNKTFSQLLILRILLLIITLIIYLLFSLTSEYKIFLIIQAIYVIGSLLDISWLYNGFENFKTTVKINSIIKILNVILIFVFIKTPSDLWKYILINALSILLGNLSLYFSINKYVKFEKTTLKQVFRHIPMTIKIFIPQIAIQLYLQLGKIMIEFITGSTVAVAYYDQADKIIKLPLALITALSTIMLPRLSYEHKSNNEENVKKYVNKSLESVFFLGVPIMFGIIGISESLVLLLLGDEYLVVIDVIKIMSPIILALCITNVIGDQYLMAINNTKQLTISYVVGLVLNLIINSLLIRKYSYMGATVSIVITEMVIIIIQIWGARKIIYKKQITFKFLKYVFSAFMMFIPVKLIELFHFDLFLTLFLQILVGVLIYFIILLILRDNLLMDVKGYLLNGFKKKNIK